MSKPHLSTPERERPPRRRPRAAPRHLPRRPSPRTATRDRAVLRSRLPRLSVSPSRARTEASRSHPCHAPCAPRRPSTPANHRSIRCSGPGATPIKEGPGLLAHRADTGPLRPSPLARPHRAPPRAPFHRRPATLSLPWTA
jgi:hypothetical protein